MSATRGNRPACHWVTVTDSEGHVHMEMRWSTPAQAVAATPHAA